MHAFLIVVVIITFSLSCQVVIAFHHDGPFVRQREWKRRIATATATAKRRTAVRLAGAKGFGASHSTSSSSNNSKDKKQHKVSSKVQAKDIEKKLTKKYGGTSPEAIARGTQVVIEAAMQALPDHVQLAARLYQTIRKWDAYYHSNRLSILEQTSIDSNQLLHMERARDEFRRLCTDYPADVSDHLMQQLYQRLTWDAAADAKAARVLLAGTLKTDLKQRIQTVRNCYERRGLTAFEPWDQHPRRCHHLTLPSLSFLLLLFTIRCVPGM
jgi:hypothetical protein